MARIGAHLAAKPWPTPLPAWTLHTPSYRAPCSTCIRVDLIIAARLRRAELLADETCADMLDGNAKLISALLCYAEFYP